MTPAETQKQNDFMAMYLPLKDRLWRYIRSMIWQRQEAQDIEADTVVIAFERFDRLQKQESFLFFLMGIARRLVRQRERKNRLLDLFRSQPHQEIFDTYPGMKKA